MYLRTEAKEGPRIYVAPPFHEESYSSFLDRICANYRIDRPTLVRLYSGRQQKDLFGNWLKSKDLPAVLSAAGLRLEDYPPHAHGLCSRALPSYAQLSYCPLCIRADLADARPPHFRRKWAMPYHTICEIHQTILVNWRKLGIGGQRSLPVKWMIRPSLDLWRSLPWLDEDMRVVEENVPSSIPQLAGPFELLMQLQQVPELLPAPPPPTSDSPALIGAIRECTALGVKATQPPRVPLAELLRPHAALAMFGPENNAGDWTIAQRGKPRPCLGANSNVGWRRSVCWFVARTLFSSSASVQLANGQEARPGGWEQWWFDVVRPALRVEHLEGANVVERLIEPVSGPKTFLGKWSD